MSTTPDHEWTLDVEHILDKIRQNAAVFSEYHKEEYYKNRGYLKYFKIPTIILSALSSVFSVGLQSYVEQHMVSVTTCLIGLFVGILNSLELFLAIQNTMENELNHSRDFYLLSVDIYKTLCLQREHRLTKGSVYLDEKYSMYCKLVESSVLTNKIVRDKMLMDNELIEIELSQLWSGDKPSVNGSPWNRLLPALRRQAATEKNNKGVLGSVKESVKGSVKDATGSVLGATGSVLDATGSVLGATGSVLGAAGTVAGAAAQVVGGVVNTTGTLFNDAGSALAGEHKTTSERHTNPKTV